MRPLRMVSGRSGALPAGPVFSAGTHTAGDVAYVSFVESWIWQGARRHPTRSWKRSSRSPGR